MLDIESCKTRRRRFLESLEFDDALVLLSNPLHIYYLTGYLIPLNDLHAEAPSWLILDTDGSSVLVTDNKAARGVPDGAVEETIAAAWYGLETPAANRRRVVNILLVEHLTGRSRRPEILATCDDRMPLEVAQALIDSDFPPPSFDVTPVLERQRMSKYNDEIEEIRAMMRVGEAMHARAREVARPGIAEFDVYRELHDAALEAAGEPLVMRCDIKATPRPNAEPKHRLRLEEGMLLLLDLFPVRQAYRCDITNTLAIGGSPSQRQQDMFALCREAMAAGEAKLKAGTPANDVYDAVRGVFERAGEADLFPHHAGHAIGLRHPEAPYLIPEDPTPLPDNSVITLEPGLYDPGAGGMRIEHNYLVTTDGFERLSNHEIAL